MKINKILIIVLFLLLSILYIVIAWREHIGRRNNIIQRIDKTIRYLRFVDANKNSNYLDDISKKIVDELRNAKPDNIMKSPIIIDCHIGYDDNGKEAILVLQWLDDVPKKYFVKILDPDNIVVYEAECQDEQYKYNLSLKENTVVFQEYIDLENIGNKNREIISKNSANIVIQLFYNNKMLTQYTGITTNKIYEDAKTEMP